MAAAMCRRAAGALVLSALALVAGCLRPKASGGATAPARNPDGALPPGCAIVADVTSAGLGPLAAAVTGLMTARTGDLGDLKGLDFGRDVQRIRFCQFSAAGESGHDHRFVVTMAGTIPANVIDVLFSAARDGVGHQIVGGLDVIGREGVLVARRGSGDGGGEIVIASDRELMQAALVGPTETYAHDASAPLSVILREDEVRRLAPASRGHTRTPLDYVSEMRFALAPGAKELTIRFVMGNPEIAGKLRPMLESAVTALITKVAGDVAPADADVTAVVDGEDVVARAALPSASLETLAARIGTVPIGLRRPGGTSVAVATP